MGTSDGSRSDGFFARKKSHGLSVVIYMQVLQMTGEVHRGIMCAQRLLLFLGFIFWKQPHHVLLNVVSDTSTTQQNQYLCTFRSGKTHLKLISLSCMFMLSFVFSITIRQSIFSHIMSDHIRLKALPQIRLWIRLASAPSRVPLCSSPPRLPTVPWRRPRLRA